MSYHHDWLMSQIEAITATLIYLLTGERTPAAVVDQFEHTRSDTNRLHLKLQLLVSQGLICQAENALFAAMDDHDPEVPEAAARFYAEINRLSDAQLQDANFSREEILSGLDLVCKTYGLQM